MRRILLLFTLLSACLSTQAQTTTKPTGAVSISAGWFRVPNASAPNDRSKDSLYVETTGVPKRYFYMANTKGSAGVTTGYLDSLLNANYYSKTQIDNTVNTKQPYGTILYDKSQWTDIVDFTTTGFTPTVSSTRSLIFSEGNEDATKYVSINGLVNNDDNTDIEITYRAIDVSGYGIAIGKKSLFGSNHGTVGYNLVTNTLQTSRELSTINKTISDFIVDPGDYCTLKLSQRGNQLTAKFTNVTQGRSITSYRQGLYINTGNIVIYNFGGNIEISQIKVTSASNRVPDGIVMGDSKMTIPVSQRVPNFLQRAGIISPYVGGSDRTSEFLASAPFIISHIKPCTVFVNYGRNDLATGIPSATWQSNYSAAVNLLEAAGFKVIHVLPIPETVISDQSVLYNWIKTNYSKTIDVSPEWDNAIHLAGDGVHPNPYGARLIADKMFNSGYLIIKDNAQSESILSVDGEVAKTNSANTFLNSQTMSGTVYPNAGEARAGYVRTSLVPTANNDRLVGYRYAASFNSGTGMLTANINNSGSGYIDGVYSNVPFLTLAGASGFGAIGTVTVSGGAVTAITPTTGGRNYTGSHTFSINSAFDGVGAGSGFIGQVATRGYTGVTKNQAVFEGAAINLDSITPTSWNNGDVWTQSNNLWTRQGGISYQLSRPTVLGIVTTGTWNGTTIAPVNGGTGQTSYAIGDLLYASSTSSLSKRASVAAGNVLLSQGVGVAPIWGKVTSAQTDGSILTTSALAPYELLANKQNSLTSDGTGTKYGTIDAINSGLALKADATGSTGYIQNTTVVQPLSNFNISGVGRARDLNISNRILFTDNPNITGGQIGNDGSLGGSAKLGQLRISGGVNMVNGLLINPNVGPVVFGNSSFYDMSIGPADPTGVSVVNTIGGTSSRYLIMTDENNLVTKNIVGGGIDRVTGVASYGNLTIQAGANSGTNANGYILDIVAGASTGTGLAGDIVFGARSSGASGTVLNKTKFDALRINGVTGKVTVPIAPTNATDVVRKQELDLKADISSLTQIVEISGTSQVGAVNTIYIPHNAALTTISLPATATAGALFSIVGEGAGGWRISQNTGQIIVAVGATTTSGSSGSISSTNANCTVTLRYTNTNKWTISASQGTLTFL